MQNIAKTDHPRIAHFSLKPNEIKFFKNAKKLTQNILLSIYVMHIVIFQIILIFRKARPTNNNCGRFQKRNKCYRLAR